MVFRRNQCAGFGGGLDDGVGVDGLDGVDVEHAGGYAFLSQRFGGLQSVGDADAGSDQGHVGTVAQEIGLAEIKLVVIVKDVFGLTAEQPDVHRALMLDDGGQGLAELHRVRGLEHGHARQGTHDAHIFKRHVRTAVEFRADARIGADDFDVQPGVAYRDGDLVEAAAGSERGERMHEGDLAAGGQPGGHADHIGLGDAHVE